MIVLRILCKILYIILAVFSFFLGLAAKLSGIAATIISNLLFLLAGLSLVVSLITGGSMIGPAIIEIGIALIVRFVPMIAEALVGIITDNMYRLLQV